MHISIFTDELGLDLAEGLPILRSWDLQHVDLRGRVFRKAFESLAPDELAEVKRLLRERGMKVACLQSSLAKVHLPDHDRRRAEAEKLEGLVRAADALDCRLARVFFYWQPKDAQRGQAAVRPDVLQQVLDLFAPLADRAKRAGLVLAFENCGVTTDECLAVLDALGEPTWGLAWDVANEWFTSPARRRDEAACTARLAARTRCVHVKAAGIVAGLGETLPWDRVLQTLDNSGLTGPVSIETHNPRPAEVSHVDMCKAVLDALRKAWPAAAPGRVEEAAPKPPAVTRDYKPVGFVVVGLGMGHARSKQITRTPGCRLIGVADIDPARAKRTGEECGVPCTDTVTPWLDNPDVEVVYVVTPTGRHAEVALEALAAGRHVLSTKPMEASLAACDEMIRLAESKRLLLGIDFDMRFNAEVLTLRAALQDRRLGRMLGGEVSLKILRTMDYFRSNGGWRGTRRWDGGGVLSNQCIHHIDQTAFVLGVPRRVRCEIRTQNHEIEGEDLGAALWEYADGALVSLFATTSYPHPTWYYRLELHGTEGAVSLASGGPVDKPQARWFIGGAWSDKPPESRESPWLNATDNFAAAVRTGAPLVCPGRDGRRTQAILDAMYRSACGTRDWVEVEPELPTR